MQIAIIDYGAGNIKSVKNAIEKIIKEKNLPNFTVIITNKKSDITSASHLILPGVGAFGDCILGLEKNDLISEIKKQVLINKKPFLGVCVGMQVMADFGYEDGKYKGLGLISGEVKKIDSQNNSLKIPHMGWNNIEILQNNHKIFQNISNNEHFYFANSYHFIVKNKNELVAEVFYGQKIAAIIAKENILGIQFHPEKSGEVGLAILENFIKNY